MEDALRTFGLKGTKDILKFLDHHGTGRYYQLAEFINVHILNLRLRWLLKAGLIEHHMERTDIKREWYTITKKGRKASHHLQELVKLMEEKG